MAKFKKGQRVKLVNLGNGRGGTYFPSESNKVGNVGTVCVIFGNGECSSFYDVRWSNGSYNSYIEDNLAPFIMEDNV